MGKKSVLLFFIVVLVIFLILVGLRVLSLNKNFDMSYADMHSDTLTNPEVTINKYLFYLNRGDVDKIKKLKTAEYACMYTEDTCVFPTVKLLECRLIEKTSKNTSDEAVYNVVYNYGSLWVPGFRTDETKDMDFTLKLTKKGWLIDAIGNG